MSCSTALLPKQTKDHPIFLRVCHSPWAAIGQKALVGLRGIILTYLIVSFGIIIDFELRHLMHGWLTVFEFSNIAYFIQILYQLIAFIWTFMHLHYPRHSQQASVPSAIQRFFSPPRQRTGDSTNRIWFSIFYTASQGFPHVSSFIFWAILIPYHKTIIPAEEIFTEGWLQAFYILSKYNFSSFLALVEIFVFSSIKRQNPIAAHVFGLIVLSGLYLGWACVGYIVTDQYGYFFLDHKQVGWEYTFTSDVGFAVLVNFFFAVEYLITWVRELLTKRNDGIKSGYQQLPQ